MTKEEIKDKIIESLIELNKVQNNYIKWLITKPSKFDIAHISYDRQVSIIESELADLIRQLEEWIELDKGWKELENSGLDKPIVFPNRPNPQDVNPYDSKAIKRTRKRF